MYYAPTENHAFSIPTTGPEIYQTLLAQIRYTVIEEINVLKDAADDDMIILGGINLSQVDYQTLREYLQQNQVKEDIIFNPNNFTVKGIAGMMRIFEVKPEDRYPDIIKVGFAAKQYAHEEYESMQFPPLPAA